MTRDVCEWPEVSLGDICELKYGKSLPAADRRPGEVPVFGSNGIIGYHDSAITCGAAIVVGRKGSFGEVSYSTRPCWPIDTTYYVDSTVTEADLRWLAYRLTGLGLTSLNRAAAVPGLNRKDAYSTRLRLPALSEQRRIAALLDNAEALRVKRRTSIAQTGQLTQTIFLEMFGDPIVNSRSWPTQRLAELGTLDRGVSKHRPRNAPHLLGGPYPLVQTGEVANCDGYIRAYESTYSEAGLKQSKMWPAGTLCITIAANIAKTGILTFPACFPDSVVGFRAEEKATVEYVRVWMSFLQERLELRAPESAQKNINLKVLRNLHVPIPPLPLQREFTRRGAAVERLKAAQRASLAKLDELLAGLQHRAFHGTL